MCRCHIGQHRCRRFPLSQKVLMDSAASTLLSRIRKIQLDTWNAYLYLIPPLFYLYCLILNSLSRTPSVFCLSTQKAYLGLACWLWKALSTQGRHQDCEDKEGCPTLCPSTGDSSSEAICSDSTRVGSEQPVSANLLYFCQICQK